MSAERPPRLEILQTQEKSWPFIDSEEDVSTIPISLEDGWEGVDNDFFTIQFSFNDQGQCIVNGYAKSVLLTHITVGDKSNIGYLGERTNFTYGEEDLPVKLMDRNTRKIYTIKSNKEPDDGAPIGAVPEKPTPSLETSVVLPIPKQNP